VYLADDFLPARFDASVLGDVPVQLYRHQRLKRALGVLPFGVSLSPGLSPPRRSGDIPIGRGQFAGSFSIVTWNAQALFASRSSRHAAKAAYVYRRCAQFDIILLQECHGTLGEMQAWSLPKGFTAYWSPGPRPGVAGIGILIRDSLEDQFDTKRWKRPWPGRAGKLELRGANGGLDIWNAYFPTGNDIADFDLGEVLPDFRSQRRSFADLRTHMRHRISSWASPVHIALTLLGG